MGGGTKKSGQMTVLSLFRGTVASLVEGLLYLIPAGGPWLCLRCSGNKRWGSV